MISIRDMQDKWNSLSVHAGGFLLVSDDHPLSFHIGYDADYQKTFVVLNTDKIADVPSSKAVKVRSVEQQNGKYALQFILLYSSLDELFAKLCWDLMDASKESDNPVSALVSQYKKWQRLLQRVQGDLLPKNIQKGLIGELLMLEELIQSDGYSFAVNCWVGPEGSDQDFDLNRAWIEVKTTTIAGTTITISSLQQLDRTDKGYLAVYHIDPTTAYGDATISLNEMISRIDMLITDENTKNIFSCKLARLGYQLKDAEKYSEFRFKVKEKELFEVDESFPRLCKSTVPIGVTEVKYDISLPAIMSYKRMEID